MNWYYVENGQSIGPLEVTEFNRLVSTGVVKGETLVWREGWNDWAEYQTVRTEPVGAATAGTEEQYAASTETGLCAECGRSFPVGSMTSYEGLLACGSCRDIFEKKAGPVAVSTGAMVYGGFWLRFVAKLIDGVILLVVNMILSFGIGLILAFAISGSSEGYESALSLVILGVQFIVRFALQAVYTTWFIGKYAATPGKCVLGFIVVRSDGSPVSYPRAFCRYLTELLSGLPTLFIGYIIAGFDDKKRALHDHICDTRVIHK